MKANPSKCAPILIQEYTQGPFPYQIIKGSPCELLSSVLEDVLAELGFILHLFR